MACFIKSFSRGFSMWGMDERVNEYLSSHPYDRPLDCCIAENSAYVVAFEKSDKPGKYVCKSFPRNFTMNSTDNEANEYMAEHPNYRVINMCIALNSAIICMFEEIEEEKK